MTDWFSTVAEIVAPPTPAEAKALADLIATLTAEPRTIRWVIECDATVGDEDDWEHTEPCGFAGETDLAIWDDTHEAIFHCPRCGGEGSVRYDSVPESSGSRSAS